ncbi:MAG: hypothetical protein ABI824_05325 [Acidobacteriota bacterium]
MAKSPQPTYQDAELILKLYDMRRETKMREARGWFFGSFKCKTLSDFMQLCPPGTEHNAHFRQVASYWDMVGSFVNTDILNADLLFMNTRELLVCWERIKPLIPELRANAKDANYLGNLEKAGEAFGTWIRQTSGDEAYTSFIARLV